jgi:acetyltransferase-like isoleucine patch superfamily enzyme
LNIVENFFHRIFKNGLRKCIKYFFSPFIGIGEFFIEFLRPTKLNCLIKKYILITRGAKIGKNPFIDKRVWVNNPKRIIIGDDVVLSKDVLITTSEGVYIGNQVMIGYGSKLIANNHVIPGDVDELIRFSGHTKGRIIIEDNVWIASNVVVTPNITIGRNSVIGAGSVVTRNIPMNSIAVGIPAKVIKRR